MRPRPATPEREAARAALTTRARGRRDNGPTLGQRLELLYVLALALAVLGSMAVSGSASLLSGSACEDAGRCLAPAGRLPLAVALALAGLGLLVRAAAAVGPVSATRAEATWLLSSPADRATLLRPAGRRVAAASAAAGAVLGWLVLRAAAPSTTEPGAVAAALVLGAAVALALVAGLAGAQSTTRGTRPWARVGAVAVALGAACAVLALAPPTLALPSPPPGGLVAAACVVAVVGALVAVAAAARRTGAIALRDLRAGGDLLASVRGSAIALDPSQAAAALAGRRLLAGGAVRSRRGHGLGLPAVVLRDVQRLARRRTALLAAVPLLVVPPLAQALLGPAAAALAAVLAAAALARAAAGGLATASRSPGLVRALPFHPHWLRAALVVAPLLLVTAWAALTALAVGTPLWTAGAVALAGTAGAVRAATGSTGPAAMGPVVVTDAGPVPTGLLARVVRGPDAALLAAVPLLLGAGPAPGLAVPAAVLVAVLTSVR